MQSIAGRFSSCILSIYGSSGNLLTLYVFGAIFDSNLSGADVFDLLMQN